MLVVSLVRKTELEGLHMPPMLHLTLLLGSAKGIGTRADRGNGRNCGANCARGVRVAEARMVPRMRVSSVRICQRLVGVQWGRIDGG